MKLNFPEKKTLNSIECNRVKMRSKSVKLHNITYQKVRKKLFVCKSNEESTLNIEVILVHSLFL